MDVPKPTAVPPTRTRTRTLTPVPPTPTKPTPVTYVVKFGDTLSGIAAQYGISVEALMIANNLTDREFIREDQILIIPKGTPTPLVMPTATMRPAAPVTRLPVPTSTPQP
jgi:LysM repeat protein